MSTAERLMEQLCTRKAELCARDRGCVQLPPMVAVTWNNGATLHAPIQGRASVAHTLQMLRAHGIFADVACAAFMSDALLKVDDRARGIRFGSAELSKQLDAGDLSILHALLVMTVERDPVVQTTLVKLYAYDDFGQPVFGDGQIEPPIVAGDVFDALRAAVR